MARTKHFGRPVVLFDDASSPNPELAVMDAELAYCLLKDRQWRLGREMLGQAIGILEPQSSADIMRRVYAEFSGHVMTMTTPLFAKIQHRQRKRQLTAR